MYSGIVRLCNRDREEKARRLLNAVKITDPNHLREEGLPVEADLVP
jgi:hypothetical protein